jgi:hypothetical protein
MFGLPTDAKTSARAARQLPLVGVVVLMLLGVSACQPKIAVVGPAPTPASIPASTAYGLTGGLPSAPTGADLTLQPVSTTPLPSRSRH